MKKCFKCNEEKEITEFYKHAQMRDGHLNKCKQCTRSDVKSNEADYESTEKGVVRILYASQKVNNRNRGFGSMIYTKKDLSNWLYENGFKELYDSWIKSGKVKALKPSPDRLDDTKGYYFENMRLTTWRENHRKGVRDRMNGIGPQGRLCKPLEKLGKDKNLIATYVSYWSAARDMGYSLEHQLKKGVKCRNGFYWKYI